MENLLFSFVFFEYKNNDLIREIHKFYYSNLFIFMIFLYISQQFFNFICVQLVNRYSVVGTLVNGLNILVFIFIIYCNCILEILRYFLSTPFVTNFSIDERSSSSTSYGLISFFLTCQ